MGWRYRKSFNLGGGFRINLSKSGIGYSWGFPGYRHTISANGSHRKTYSLPGTGISYVESSGSRRNNSNNNQNYNYNQNTKLITGVTTYYQNSNISNMGKGDEILKAINKLRIIDILANICLILIVLFPVGIILKVLIAKKWKLDLTYEMDDINQKKFNALNEFLAELKNNRKLWQIGSSTRVYNTKYNAGAGNNVSRTTVSLVKKMPWYIDHNIDVYCLKLKNEKIFFTPDRMIIFKNTGGVGCRKYDDMVAGFNTTNFVETEMVPRDAEIIDYTWRYVNKSGGPDKRFSNNKRIPVCRYGELSLESSDGINILLECSNYNLMYSIQDKFAEFMNYHNKIISTKGYKEEYEMDDFEYESYNDISEDINKTNEIVITEKEIIDEDIKDMFVVDEVNNSNVLPKNNEDDSNISKKSTLLTALYYLQIVFAAFMVIGCISEKMVLGTFIWLFIALIFIPKIKELICVKFSFAKKYIIPIRIVLVFLGIMVFSTLSYQFEGTWINDNGDKIIIDSSLIKENGKETTYSYKSKNENDYDYVYEIKGKYKEEDVIFMYYKKNKKESLCIYQNNECLETFKKITE